MGKAVLVVDDEPSNLSFLMAVLRRHGFEAVEAINAENALHLIHAAPSDFDLLVIDIRLPGDSGFILAERVAEQYKAVRFLFVSGSPTEAWNANDMAAIRALNTTRYCFLPKPFTSQSIAECLTCVLIDPETRRSSCPKHGLHQIAARAAHR
jgi:DNA-binding NtrC family response regulator